MLSLIIWGMVFVVSLAVLIKAADYFTSAAEKVGKSLGMPLFIVGVIIVAIGTSLPELVAGVIAAFENATEVVVGNAVGSNITNILLVVGAAIVVGRKMSFDYQVSKVDLIFFLGSALLLTAAIWDGVFTLVEGVLFLLCIAVYLITIVFQMRKDPSAPDSAESAKFDWKNFGILIVSAAFVYLGAKFTILALIELSMALNIGKEIIALSAVALGTSLPELVVAIVAAKKGMPGMVAGNILGSNIFNALAVMGLPSLVTALVVPPSILIFFLPAMLASTLLFFIFLVRRKEVVRWQGVLLLIGYVAFIGMVFGVEVL